jgi:RNA polymerase sigma factor (sigma-70 family)
VDHLRGESRFSTSPTLGTLFRLTLASGVAAAVELHIKRGAPIDGRDAQGRTPLMLAAMRGHLDVCRVLLHAGANPALRDPSGDDAISLARVKGHSPVLALLAAHLSPSLPASAEPPAAVQQDGEAAPLSAAVALEKQNAQQREASAASGLAPPPATPNASSTTDGQAEVPDVSVVLDGADASDGWVVEEDLGAARIGSGHDGGAAPRSAIEVPASEKVELAGQFVIGGQSSHRAVRSSEGAPDPPTADQLPFPSADVFTSAGVTALQGGGDGPTVPTDVLLRERNAPQPGDCIPSDWVPSQEAAIGTCTTDTQTVAQDACWVPEDGGGSTEWVCEQDAGPAQTSSEPADGTLLRPSSDAPPEDGPERPIAKPAHRFVADEQAYHRTAQASRANTYRPNAAQQPVASAGLAKLRGAVPIRRQADDGSPDATRMPNEGDTLATGMVPDGSVKAEWEPEPEPDLTPSGTEIAAAAAQREIAVSRYATDLPDPDWTDTHIDLPDTAPAWRDAFKEGSNGFRVVTRLVSAGLREGCVLVEELDALRKALVDGDRGQRLAVALEILLADLGILVEDEHAIDSARMAIFEGDDLQTTGTAYEVAAAADRLTEIWGGSPDAERLLLETVAGAPVLSKAAETRLFHELAASLTLLQRAASSNPLVASFLERWADQLDARSVLPREISEADWGAADQDSAEALDPDEDTQLALEESAFADFASGAGNAAADALAAHLRATARTLLQRGAARELMAAARLTPRRILELTEACLGQHGTRRREGLRASIRHSEAIGHELAVLRRPASKVQQSVGPEVLGDAFQRYIDARQAIVEANLKRVVWLARRYARAAVPFLDLVQEGQIGLLRAIDRFDPKRGFRFGTYATWWIRQSISRYVQDQGRTVRVPVHMLERIAKTKRVSEALRAKNGMEPTPRELADALEIDVLSVERALAADLEGIWLDDTGALPDEEAEVPTPLVDEATPLTALLHHDLRRLLAASLRNLDARQARIIDLRFGLTDGNPLTLEEVGQVYRVTRERIRQIEAKALKRLPRLLPNRQFENLVP